MNVTSKRFVLYFQVNRVFGWEPEPYYNISEVRGLVEMPRGLRDHIGA